MAEHPAYIRAVPGSNPGARTNHLVCPVIRRGTLSNDRANPSGHIKPNLLSKNRGFCLDF